MNTSTRRAFLHTAVLSSAALPVNVNQNKWRRASPAAASATVRPGSCSYFAPQVKIDATVSYIFSRRYSVYADVRNLMGTPQRRGVYSPDVPGYARIDLAQYPARRSPSA
jgi:hypothetical protein